MNSRVGAMESKRPKSVSSESKIARAESLIAGIVERGDRITAAVIKEILEIVNKHYGESRFVKRIDRIVASAKELYNTLTRDYTREEIQVLMLALQDLKTSSEASEDVFTAFAAARNAAGNKKDKS